jgi:histone H3/H4
MFVLNLTSFCCFSESFRSIDSTDIDFSYLSSKSGWIDSNQRKNKAQQQPAVNMVRSVNQQARLTGESSSDSSAPLRSPTKSTGNQRSPAKQVQSKGKVGPKPAAKQTPQRRSSTNRNQSAKPVGAKKRKGRPRVLKEIRRLQSTVTPLIPRACLLRVVREIMNRLGLFRISREAIEALREAAETYSTNVLNDAYMITLNRRQVTLQPRDIHLLMMLRGGNLT